MRVLPFGVFMAVLALRGMAPTDGRWGFEVQWLYGLNLLLVGGLLWAWRKDYGELARQNLPGAGEALLAVAVGLLVFVLWMVVLF